MNVTIAGMTPRQRQDFAAAYCIVSQKNVRHSHPVGRLDAEKCASSNAAS